jgi:tetratricopeptide (TPR) repeat protein
MKRITTLIAFMIIATVIFAQRAKVTSALSFKESGDLKKAWEAIQEASDPNNDRAARSLDWPRTFEVKGSILQDIHRMGTKGLVDEPLFEALEAYKKAIELDEGGRSSKSLIVALTFLQTDLTNYAMTAYEKERFDIALLCFEKYMEISNISIMKNTDAEVIDTAIVYNSGLSAFKAENYEKALFYFLKSARLGYNGPSSYHFSFQSSQAKGDTLQSIKLLEEGFEKYPESETLIVELINHYRVNDKDNDAIIYLDRAISQNPDNVTFYTAKGSSLEKMGREDDAVVVYNKAIEVDPKAFTPYYNLGVIFFNRGVTVMNEATQLPPSAQKEYEEKFEAGKVHLKDALPYFEKAYELNTSEVAILESLRLIYYRLQMNDKYEEMSNKIQNIKN